MLISPPATWPSRPARNDQKGLCALRSFALFNTCEPEDGWRTARPVVEGLRVDPSVLAAVDRDQFDLNLGNYSSRRVRKFLQGLREDLGQ